MSHLTKTTIIVIVIIVALIPHSQPCGAPGHSCATAPDERGIYTIFDDIQPSIVSALEYMFDSDIRMYYRREKKEQSVIN